MQIQFNYAMCVMHKSAFVVFESLKRYFRCKCCIAHLGRDSLGCMYRLPHERLGSNPAERDLGILGNSKLNMSHQCYSEEACLLISFSLCGICQRKL